MTRYAKLVNMNAWTLDDIRTRVHQLAVDPHATDDRAVTRIHILDIATDHFQRFGFRKTSVADVAREAGVAKGSLYNHFDSKTTLLVAAVVYEKVKLLPEIQRVYALPPEQQLRAYLEMSLRFTLTAPLTSRLLRGDPEIERILAHLDADQEQDRKRGADTIATFIAAAAPAIDDEVRAEVVELVTAVLYLVAHLPDIAMPMQLSTERFVTLYTDILTTGIQGLAR